MCVLCVCKRERLERVDVCFGRLSGVVFIEEISYLMINSILTKYSIIIHMCCIYKLVTQTE